MSIHDMLSDYVIAVNSCYRIHPWRNRRGFLLALPEGPSNQTDHDWFYDHDLVLTNLSKLAGIG